MRKGTGLSSVSEAGSDGAGEFVDSFGGAGGSESLTSDLASSVMDGVAGGSEVKK